MHAKVTVADDVVFAGSFNLSRSGEMNAENVLEVHDPELAEQLAGVHRRDPRPLRADAYPGRRGWRCVASCIVREHLAPGRR